MRISTVPEFRDKATGLLRSREPILITRRGRMAGVFFRSPEGALRVDLKRELFEKLSAEIGRRLTASGVSEKEVQSDFESWRKARRETRRRR
jgi:formylmethanofuran dehydrogenase subunit E